MTTEPTAGSVPFGNPHKGTAGYCADCELSVHVAAAPKPSVCPLCQKSLSYEGYNVPPPSAEVPDHITGEPRYKKYKRPPRWAVLSLSLASIIILAVVVYFQLTNIEHYWYAPLVNFYSLVAGVFIISRFLIAAFYVAPHDTGYEPVVTVCVPCRNEEDSIITTIVRIYSEGYPHAKLEVITVNDASTDRTFEQMLKVQSRFPALVIVNFHKNRGLSHGMATSTLLARGDIMLYVDSDTFLLPGSVRKVVQGLADPTVAGVAGHTDVENCDTNTLTKMQDLRYYVSYKVMKAAESVFGAVSCLPGCFSAYRKACVLQVMKPWLAVKFLGRYGNFADDRSLTNCVLRNYKVLYDDEALATTIVPDNWNKYIRQQARWTRSWVREIFVASLFLWRKHPVTAISWYTMMFMPVLEPVVMLQALILGPLFYGQMTSYYIIGVLAITLLWSLYFYEKTGRTYWWTGIVFTFSYTVFFSWQVYYALATMRQSKWGTR